MNDYQNFEWDENKALSNVQKHGITFDIALRIFSDPLALMFQDRIEQGEYRWQTIGRVNNELLLLVAHTLHDDEGIETIRIISARRANTKERKRYEQEND